MPNIPSAKKRLRQSKTRAARNRTRLRTMKQAISTVRDAIEAGNTKEARQLLPTAYKAIDKAAQSGPLHKNTAARYKRRLTAHLNNATS